MICSVDLPRSFTIRERSHRIHNPLTSEKMATLGQAVSPPRGTGRLDLACGSGEMLCTWAAPALEGYPIDPAGTRVSTAFAYGGVASWEASVLGGTLLLISPHPGDVGCGDGGRR
jgi:hypothetical protein